MSIARAQERLDGADIRLHPVNASTVRKGFPVKYAGTFPNVIECAAIGDNGIGIA